MGKNLRWHHTLIGNVFMGKLFRLLITGTDKNFLTCPEAVCSGFRVSCSCSLLGFTFQALSVLNWIFRKLLFTYTECLLTHFHVVKISEIENQRFRWQSRTNCRLFTPDPNVLHSLRWSRWVLGSLQYIWQAVETLMIMLMHSTSTLATSWSFMTNSDSFTMPSHELSKRNIMKMKMASLLRLSNMLMKIV